MCKRSVSKKFQENNPILIKGLQGVHPNRLTVEEFTDALAHMKRLLEIALGAPDLHGDHIEPLRSTIRKFQKHIQKKDQVILG